MIDENSARLPKVRLDDALNYLWTLSRENVRSDEALRRLRVLRQVYPECVVDLLWEQDPYSKEMHYDVLVHMEGEGSVSLSVCLQGGTPWPLRGVQSRRERDLLRVNHETVDVMSAMALIDVMRDKTQVMAHLVRQCLIQGAIKDRGLEVSDEEVESVVDRFRLRRGLYSIEKTQEWLDQRGMTTNDLYEMLAAEAAKLKLREEIASGQIDDYFASHESQFDTVHLARLCVRGEDEAGHLIDRLKAGQIDFLEAAQQRFLGSAKLGAGELFVVLRRDQIPTVYSDDVFQAGQGDLLGPFRINNQYEILRVLQTSRAKIDDGIREAVKDELFENWLDLEREKATIEWFW